MRLGLVRSRTSDVTLAAARAILDDVTSPSAQGNPPNVAAHNITLTAGINGISNDPNEMSGAGGVGTPADFLTVQANAEGPDAAGNIGVLSITAKVADNDAAQRALAFDPLHLVDGIEASDDPLLELRSAVYAVSRRRRK